MNQDKIFNCLDPDTKILGHKLLQASAGTGKTFAIEHIFLRLILEGIPIEEILVVTFTNAATYELKQRIYAVLEKGEKILKHSIEDPKIAYLKPYQKDLEAIEKIQEALFSFDLAQIFTIHSFCYRMLSEYSFEAGMVKFHELNTASQLEPIVHMYLLYHLDETICLPSQISYVAKKIDLQKGLVNQISQEGKEHPFEQLFTDISDLFSEYSLENTSYEQFMQELEKVQGNYKKTGFSKENFPLQMELLSKLSFDPTNRSYLDAFLFTKATIVHFLSIDNQKQRCKPIKTVFLVFIEKLKKKIDQILNRQSIMDHLTFHMKSFVFSQLHAKQSALFDDFLHNMQKALQNPSFCQKVKSKYKGVIIDEFQDTDPVQWDIFSQLFVKNKQVLSFYLVGDPKQSIYAFRKADIYTYLQAAKQMEEILYLDTNYRSDRSLIDSLNTFFKTDWMHLPKYGQTLSYHPVKGVLDLSFQDIHKPLHFMIAKEGPNLEEEVFFPYICSEIQRLYQQGEKYSHFAVLVKDRYQEQKLVSFFNKVNIPSIARIQPLKETLGLQVFIEIFEAIKDPKDRSKVIKALANCFSEEEITSYHHQIFYQFHHTLSEKGVEKCLSALLFQPFDQKSLLMRFKEEVVSDFLECIDLLLSFLNHQIFTHQLLEEFLEKIQSNSEQRVVTDLKDAVQVITIHKSKGLEYEIVFCLGLAFSGQSLEISSQEILAEKLRQQYVGLTRAKKKVYAPIVQTQKERHSPMELFLKSQGVSQENMQSYLEKHAAHFSFTHLAPQKITAVNLPKQKPKQVPFFASLNQNYRSKTKVLSFSSITTSKQKRTFDIETNLPKGIDTGILIHKLLEKALFCTNLSVSWVAKHLLGTFLEGFEEIVYTMIDRALSIPLGPKSFCLKDVNKKHILCEIEFMYPNQSQLLKGTIDLIFKQDGLYYLLDWKTNFLPNYDQSTIEQAMKDHNYFVQAAIYAQALKGAVEQIENKPFEMCFGGVFYLFLRGIEPKQGIYHFIPDLQRGKYV